MGWTGKDYLEITGPEARRQWRLLDQRPDCRPGARQENFMPIETILSLAASLVIDHHKFRGAWAFKAGAPVAQLAKLFRRPPASVIAKMDNLEGSRTHGAKFDTVVGDSLRTNPELLTAVYGTIFSAARAEGVDESALPDFLVLEVGDLLGQDELDPTAIEYAFEKEIDNWRIDRPGLSERETERRFAGVARVGQHIFASRVLVNCGFSCVFCGMSSPVSIRPKLLVASHVKPWRDSSSYERLDVSNGIAACPTHDRAFDAGLLTLSENLEIQVAPSLAAHVDRDPAAKAAFGAPPLRSHVDPDQMADQPRVEYIAWHRERIYQPTAALLDS